MLGTYVEVEAAKVGIFIERVRGVEAKAGGIDSVSGSKIIRSRVAILKQIQQSRSYSGLGEAGSVGATAGL